MPSFLTRLFPGRRCYALGSLAKMNMYQAINDALKIAVVEDKDTEDVLFGGVFRCTAGIRELVGTSGVTGIGQGRIFNTPISEQGIAGFALGYVSNGGRAIVEMQFADYIYPAFDQIVNEIAKYRYRSGGHFNAGGLTIRAPFGGVGHGGLYHSQSPEGFFTHAAGLKIVVPRGPRQAKGLLLSSINDPNPVIFFEPKALYRQGKYLIPLSRAEVVREGTDLTILSWGAPLGYLSKVVERARDELDVSAELIDLQTLIPWDESTVVKTGRLLIVHEAPKTSGFSAEIASVVQEKCFLSLKAPVFRECGWDTPFPLVHDKLYCPDAKRCYSAIKAIVSY